MNTKENYFQQELLVTTKNLGISCKNHCKNKKARVKKNQKMSKIKIS